jgi:hypothetical protein
VDEFTDELALADGGWDRRFARVLAKAVLGDRAVAIIDSNGAHGGAPVYENTDVDRWDPQSEWTWTVSGGGYGSGWSDGMAYASERVS